MVNGHDITENLFQKPILKIIVSIEKNYVLELVPFLELNCLFTGRDFQWGINFIRPETDSLSLLTKVERASAQSAREEHTSETTGDIPAIYNY